MNVVDASIHSAEAFAGAKVITLSCRRIAGDDASQRVWDAVHGATKDFAGRVVLDFAQVEFLSSMALGKLISLQTKIRQRGGSLTICGLTDDLAQIFRVSRLDRVLDCRATLNEAMG